MPFCLRRIDLEQRFVNGIGKPTFVLKAFAAISFASVKENFEGFSKLQT